MMKSSKQRQAAAKAANKKRVEGFAKSSVARREADESKHAYVATATGMQTGGPNVIRTKEGCRIQHRELVATTLGSTVFTVNAYRLNPGLVSTFPWLSAQASSWEQYRFNRLSFEYITRTATTTVGSVILVPEYDPSDPAPLSEAAATGSLGAHEDVPWKDIVCPLRPDLLHGQMPRKYTRNTRVAGDIRNFDVGTFFVCTVAEAGPDPIGKLWISYDVDFYIPQTAVAAAVAAQTSMFGAVNPITTATGVLEVLVPDISYVDGLNVGPGVAGVYTPPAGTYMVTLSLQTSDDTAETYNCNARIRKNSGDVVVRQEKLLSIAGGALCTIVRAYVSMNGTDTLDAAITATGAGGILTCIYTLDFTLA